MDVLGHKNGEWDGGHVESSGDGNNKWVASVTIAKGIQEKKGEVDTTEKGCGIEKKGEGGEKERQN